MEGDGCIDTGGRVFLRQDEGLGLVLPLLHLFNGQSEDATHVAASPAESNSDDLAAGVSGAFRGEEIKCSRRRVVLDAFDKLVDPGKDDRLAVGDQPWSEGSTGFRSISSLVHSPLLLLRARVGSDALCISSSTDSIPMRKDHPRSADPS